MDNALYDRQIQLLPHQSNRDVIIIEIDDQSLGLIGPWPWDRSLHAELLSKLGATRLVVYNILIDDNQISDQSDRLFKSALTAHGRTLLPVYAEQTLVSADKRMVLPDADIADQVMLGHVNSYVDDDGILRRINLFDEISGRHWPHFSLLAAQQAGQVPLSLHNQSRLLVPFSQLHFNSYSFVDVVTDQIDSRVFTDKVVFVGVTAAAVGDPLLVSGAADGMQTPAVYINAAAFHAIQNEQWISELPIWLVCVFSFLLVVVAVTLVPRLSGINQIAVTTALLLCSFCISQVCLYRGYWFPVSALMIALLLIPFLWNLLRLSRLYRYLKIEVERLSEQQSQQSFRLPDSTASTLQEEGDMFSRQLSLLQRIRQAADQSQALFEHSIDSIASGIIVSDQSGNILFRNKVVKILFTKQHSQLFDQLASIALNGKRNWDDVQSQALHNSEIAVYEGRYNERELAVSIRCLHDPLLASPLLVVNLADITEIKRAQQSRLETIDFLSHDLRSPMASIRALVQQAKNQTAPLDIGDLLSKVDRYSERSLYFAEQFLQLARVESDSEIELYEVDLYAVCQDAMDSLYHQAQAKSQLIDLQCDNNCWAMANGELLERVVLNLLSNAIKYSPENSVITVRVRALDQSDDIQVRISDQGSGIPEALQGKLFGSFQRGSSGQGVGLGLRFVDIALQRHGSQIKFESCPSGSTFYFNLTRI